MSGIPRQVLLHAAAGALVAAVFVGALMLSGPGAVLRADMPGPVLLLWLFCSMTFGVSLAATALALPEGPERPGSRTLVPVPVRARRRR